ncbi:MAG TPA: AMIN domain-containing protein [Oligoflexia bacterium]|nr:AMIN domain-containing protein [Oligoflexia bacterium]HMP49645.1 AMIN domain-containing protein [Oligoflexia bacterium]
MKSTIKNCINFTELNLSKTSCLSFTIACLLLFVANLSGFSCDCQADELGLKETTPATSAFSREIPFNGFNLAIVQIAEDSLELKINFTDKTRKVEGFIVENPYRIVIDIEGAPSSIARSLKLDSKLVSRLRVGIHPDKTRIVLDSNTKNNIDIKEYPSGTKDSILFKAGFNIPTSASSSEENKKENKLPNTIQAEKTTSPVPLQIPVIPSPTPTGKIIPSPEPSSVPLAAKQSPASVKSVTPIPTPGLETKTTEESNDEIETDTSGPIIGNKSPAQTAKTEVSFPALPASPAPPINPKEEKTETDVNLARLKSQSDLTKDEATQDKKVVSPNVTSENKTIEQPRPDDPRAVVKNIVFQASSENFKSSVVVIASKLGLYELKKKSANEYELTLKMSRLKADYLTLPQFPPDSFKGFRYIKSSQGETDISVQIFVDDGTRLTAFIADEKLWVRVD